MNRTKGLLCVWQKLQKSAYKIRLLWPQGVALYGSYFVFATASHNRFSSWVYYVAVCVRVFFCAFASQPKWQIEFAASEQPAQVDKTCDRFTFIVAYKCFFL